MNSANNTNNSQGSISKVQSQPITVPGVSSGKEKEPSDLSATELVSEITTEMEIPEEVEKAGVKKTHETVELPPDVKKLGITPTGSSTPIDATTTLPKVILPMTDQQVVVGLHAQIINSFRWLAVWCIKKLKKAHLALKVIHGKIVRVKTK